jgi:hypothetical protein
MSGKHGHSHNPFEGHMHEFDAHIRAVEEIWSITGLSDLNRAFSIYYGAAW